ncbi:MAG TPA: SusD/RagB family nutrient-binding outer membrane lipoprotein [Chitinophagaceae bacterium]|nr:SusD/RagB family nutrient-binding outer membrane lipoprotein [Chitinophagaceae bacterium]
MKMRKIIVLASIILLAACSKLNDKLDSQLNDPSAPTPDAADIDLYLNNLELNFNGFYQTASDLTDPLMRMETMFGPTYYNAYSASSYDGLWNSAYTSIFKTANTMIPLAAAKNQFIHSGIAKTLKAYTMITLVDLFGDIPYTEANLGVTNTNPKVDKGRLVYDSALALLDAAIADFGKTASSSPGTDLFYAGNKTKWATFAKTIKLKAYVQTRLVDQANVTTKINALLAENDLIDTPAEDFVFNYSTKDQAPDSRAPHYVSNYGTNTGTADYLGNHFMWALVQEKGIVDPRARYYIYRQITDITNDSRLPDQTTTQFALACYYRTSPYPTGSPYCIVGTGYWGRDHGNNEGTGPDGLLKSTWGLYPVGGEFDADQNKSTGQGSGRQSGAKGAGIGPIWISAFTYFLKAEAALTLGTTGDAQALLLAGVNESFNKVKGFAGTIGYSLPTTDTTKLITTYKQQQYVNKVQSLYQAAATTSDKLNVLEREYYLAAWGNGLEPYNNYRRTGKPENLQRTLLPNEGDFIRSFFYPSIYVDFNKSAVQKTVTSVQVFWDNNPKDFIH